MAEHQSLLNNTSRKNHKKRSCGKYYRLRFTSSKGAILVLFWDIMLYVFGRFCKSVIFDLMVILYPKSQLVFIVYTSLYFIAPLGGLVADIWIGRYKIIVAGIYMTLFMWILGASADALFSYVHPLIIATLLIFSMVMNFGSITLIQTNLISFNIDQLVGASGEDLSTIIYWHAFGLSLGIYIKVVLECWVNKTVSMKVTHFPLGGLVITVIILSHIFFKHWLDITHQKSNPIKLIAKVLNYARKNKYPKNRSAFTYCEEQYPSRIDLGKEKYGGPFSDEEVEDVKTVLRMIPLYICIFGFYLAWELVSLPDFLSNAIVDRYSYGMCIIGPSTISLITLGVFVLLYQFLIYPCFYKYIPSMLKRIGLGLILCFLTSFTYMIIALVGQVKNSSAVCVLKDLPINSSFEMPIDYHWVIVPEVICGIAYFLVLTISLEFTVAQSPKSMRGFMVGIRYATIGLAVVVSMFFKTPFKYLDSAPLGCGFYYFLSKTVLIFIILVMFILLAKRYKLRVRDNETNVYQIVDEHFERFLRQSDEFWKSTGVCSDYSLN